MNEDKMLTITKEEYKQLQDDSLWLNALREVGVDNWEGYSEAHEVYELAKKLKKDYNSLDSHLSDNLLPIIDI